MADKRISQLVERTDIANNDVLPIVASGATTTNKVTVSTLQDWMQDNLDVGVTSVGLSVPSAFTVSGSPVTTSGNITISGAGTTAQYIRGDGSLADFPSSLGGGGASVSYYLNGSVNQGTIGGVAYRELSKSPILGAGTDFTINADGYIASFITDAGDPSLLEIPGGNWNFETYFQASSGGGTPTFYVELYKVSSGGTATLIATSSGSPELIAFGTNITPYFSSLAVPTTTLALTDRLAIRYYVAHSGRTITLHTENNTLCQIITTFTTGLTALNGLTAQVQNFATGTSGTDFNISSASTTHTFNLPDASASNRGVVTTGTQTFAGYKIFNGTIGANVDIQLATQGTALNTFLKNINATGQTSIGSNGFGFNNANNIYFSGSSKGGGIIAFNNTGNQTYTLQNASGTLAFTSDLGGYLPLTGGTLTGALNGTSAVFSGDVQSGTRLIAAASSQSIILTPNSGGSTNRVESVGTLPLALVSAAAITMAAGGTTPQITLATSGAVTLTGALNGTTSTFGGTGTGNNVIAISNNDQSNVRLRITNTGAGGRTYSIVGGLNGANNSSFSIYDETAGSTRFDIASTGAATFSSSVTATELYLSTSSGLVGNINSSATNGGYLTWQTAGTTIADIGTANQIFGSGGAEVFGINARGARSLSFGTNNTARLTIASTGAATFSGSVTTGGNVLTPAGSGLAFTGDASRIITPEDNVSGALIQTPGIIRFNAGGTSTRMTITAAGNVGIGTASPATAGGGYTNLHINGNGSSLILSTNGSNLTYLYTLGTGGIDFAIENSGAQVFRPGGSERMRITSAGNVGIGTASPTSISGYILQTINGVSGSFTEYQENGTNTFRVGSDIGAGGFLFTQGALGIRFGTNGSERMRITSGGFVLVNRTTTLNNGWFEVNGDGSRSGIACNQVSTGTSYQIYFSNPNGIVGSISTNGSATSYTTSSDYRLKEDLQEIKGLERVSALKVYDFKWKDSEERSEGVLAHELEEVMPYAVTGEKDGEQMQGVDYSKIVPVLIKAIQELKAEIDSLKTK